MKRLAEIAHFAADVDRTVQLYEAFLGIKLIACHASESAVFLLGGVKLLFHVSRVTRHDSA